MSLSKRDNSATRGQSLAVSILTNFQLPCVSPLTHPCSHSLPLFQIGSYHWFSCLRIKLDKYDKRTSPRLSALVSFSQTNLFGILFSSMRRIQVLQHVNTGIYIYIYIIYICIAHWFTSLSTLARYDEPGLNLALRIFILHCYQVRPHSSVLR